MRKVAGLLNVGDVFLREDNGIKYSVEVMSTPEKGFKCCTLCDNMHLSNVSFQARKVDSGEIYQDKLNSIAVCDLVKSE